MRIGLVLGSGGARGYAHIGVIDELLARGHEIAAISGTSMGALIGGLYAGGQLESFKDWVISLSGRDVFFLLDPVLGGPGAVRLERVFARVEEIMPDQPIEDLPIPFTAVATDLFAQREIWFKSGSLIAAIRASVAIPSVVTPVMINGRVLIDGGVTNPLPMDPIIGESVDRIIAVDLAGGRKGGPLMDSPNKAEDTWQQALTVNPLLKAIADGFANIVPPPPAKTYQDLPKELKTTDIVQISLDTMQGMITRYRLAASPPDVLVEVPQSSASTLDFHRAGELITLGRELAVTAFDQHGI